MFFAGSKSHAINLFISANVLPRNMFYFETVFLLWTTDLPILHLRTSVISSPIYPIFIYITPTSFPGSLFSPSLEREKGREEERPWERGWHNTRFSNVYNLYVNKSRLRSIWLGNSLSVFEAKL